MLNYPAHCGCDSAARGHGTPDTDVTDGRKWVGWGRDTTRYSFNQCQWNMSDGGLGWNRLIFAILESEPKNMEYIAKLYYYLDYRELFPVYVQCSLSFLVGVLYRRNLFPVSTHRSLSFLVGLLYRRNC